MVTVSLLLFVSVVAQHRSSIVPNALPTNITEPTAPAEEHVLEYWRNILIYGFHKVLGHYYGNLTCSFARAILPHSSIFFHDNSDIPVVKYGAEGVAGWSPFTCVPIHTLRWSPVNAIETPAPPSDCNCGIANTDKRIIGGLEINPPRKYPWLVALRMPGNYSCGGSIINDRYILTAAHCFYNFNNPNKCFHDPPQQLNILIGDHHQFETSDNDANTAMISMKDLIIHPNYSCKSNNYDFGRFELSEAIQLNDVIKPVCLPIDDSKTYDSDIGTAAGWEIKDDGGQSYTPFEVDVPILDINCGGYETITSNMMCAGYPETGGKDSCQGDSEGPLIVNENGKYVQVGVTSWGIGCGWKNHPGVYARVSKVLDWIKSASASGQ
ncbi:unnamed protein product, partial [Meganyctiphanes norvegica]